MISHFNPLTPTVATWVHPYMKHLLPDRVKLSFVIFNMRALRCSDPVWHRMPYSCIHMATAGVKGLKNSVTFQPGQIDRRNAVVPISRTAWLRTRTRDLYVSRLVCGRRVWSIAAYVAVWSDVEILWGRRDVCRTVTASSAYCGPSFMSDIWTTTFCIRHFTTLQFRNSPSG